MTDTARTLDALAGIDFDFMIAGHGPVLTKQEFLERRDRIAAMLARAREVVREGKSQDAFAQTLAAEFNWGSGPAAGNIPGLMLEFE